MDLNKFWRGIAAFELLKQCEHFVPACGQEPPEKYRKNIMARNILKYSQDDCASFLL